MNIEVNEEIKFKMNTWYNSSPKAETLNKGTTKYAKTKNTV